MRESMWFILAILALLIAGGLIAKWLNILEMRHARQIDTLREEQRDGKNDIEGR